MPINYYLFRILSSFILVMSALVMSAYYMKLIESFPVFIISLFLFMDSFIVKVILHLARRKQDQRGNINE